MMSKLLPPLVLVVAAVAALGLAAVRRSDSPAPARPQPQLKIDAEPVTNGQSGLVTSYADVVEPVQRAVVSVYSSKVIRQRLPIHPLFRQFYGDIPDRESREEGLGSGVIVSADGYILTNHHVVQDADELNVSLPDGREFKAELIGSDPKTDVAVIRIEGSNLPTVTLANSDTLRVGDIVFAVGNPLGIGQTVTMGIVSAKGRNNLGLLEQGEGYEDFIQTDAAINMGNSGGALVDAKGRLVGINTAIISTTRGNIGIGFAIPVNLAASIMQSLVDTGGVKRGFLGVSVETINPELAATLGLKEGVRGVAIVTLTPDGPAEQAGLQRGDAIIRIDGRSIRSLQDLRLVVSQIAPGTGVPVEIVREGRERTVTATLGSLDDATVASAAIVPGVTVERVTPEVRRRMGLPEAVNGLLVTEVDARSAFARSLVPGMVIIEINREPVTDVAAARALIREGRNLFLVFHRGTMRFLPVQVR
jgi:Do/DeqQ family serine protease